MFKYFERRFSLSEQGVKEFTKGIFFTFLHYISLMFPTGLTYFFLQDYLQVTLNNAAPVHHFLFYTLVGLVLWCVMYVLARFQYRSTFISTYNESAKRRIELAEKLRKLPLSFFSEKNLSDLTATLMDDCTALESIFSHAIPQLFAALLSLVVIAIGTFIFNWPLSIALFWVVPFAALSIFLSQKLQTRWNSKNYQAKRVVTEKIQEGLETIQDMKSYNQEAKYIESLSKSIDEYEGIQIKTEIVVGGLVSLSHVLVKLGMVSVVIVGALMLEKHSIDLFTYLVFLLISASVYNPIQDVFNHLAVLLFLDVRIQRIREMETLPIQAGETNFSPQGFDIEFQSVGFSYEKEKKVLSDVSFIAEQGKITALVGPSGGGKSTAAKLAARFWDLDTGKILLGGVDISTIEPETLLQYYSVVFQDVTLFNSSIADNIRIGKKDATEADIIKAAKAAQCHEFIQRMPDGYDTILSENGDTLSGGERQRLSIARALLKDAPIILLDEATASIDVENETKIQAAISALVKNKTLLIIAHRMRTIASADRIVVLKDGTVKECGSPTELTEQQGIFTQMVHRQSH